MRLGRPAAWLWPGLCCCLMFCVITAYAALLPRARWQGDEYLVFAWLREGGWAFYLHWYLTWSPRLVSNMFYGAYGAAVLAWHRPLAGSCMAILWAGLACACVAPAWRTNAHRLSRLAAGLSLFALFLVGHSVTEVFYWPAGGLSYVPTLAGTVWLFWLLLDGLETRVWRHVAAGLALFLVAGSSEVGIFTALSIAACIGCVQLRTPWRRSLWLLPGLAMALVDLALVLHGRVGTIEVGGEDPAVLHHAGAALLRGLVVFAGELVRPNLSGGPASSAALSAASRILVFLGAHWSLGKARAPGGLLPAFGAALLLAAFASLASGYFQFGRLCCARHETMRACFIILAVAAFGAAWPRMRAGAGAAAWAAAAILLFVPAVPALLADYRSMDGAIAARAQTWASGASSGDTMVFIIEPPGRVISGGGLTPGFATVSPELAWWQLGILQFFGKRSVSIELAK